VLNDLLTIFPRVRKRAATVDVSDKKRRYYSVRAISLLGKRAESIVILYSPDVRACVRALLLRGGGGSIRR
jgi:hypothetical protein